MKKQISMLAAIILVLFFSGIKKDNIKKIESLSIFADDKVSTTDSPVPYRLPVPGYSRGLTASSDNSWKTYLLPD